MDIRETVAVVTGGATGIGRATAVSLATAGAAGIVVNYAHSAAEAESLVAELTRIGASAVAEQADVGDDAQVRGLAERVAARYGRVNVLVNNAAITRAVPHGDLDALTDTMWRDVLDVNVVGAFRCARAFAPALRSTRGAVVNIASISGFRAGGSSIAYGTSKAALLQLTRNLAIALAPDVRVNAVAPGTTATRWQTDLHGAAGFAALAEAEQERIPLGGIAEPDHIAQAVLGLLSMDDVTGESIIVDGGRHAAY